MMACIDCMAIRKDEIKDGVHVRDWEVTVDGRLWPCCYYANAWDDKWERIQMFDNDPELQELWESNPDFNNLQINKSNDVINNHMYDKYINNEGWNSDSPPALCVKECSVVIDERTQQSQSKAKIQVEK